MTPRSLPWGGAVRLAIAICVLALLGTACGDDTASPASPVPVDDTTSTTSSALAASSDDDAPPVLVASAPGPEGYLAVELHPEAWSGLAVEDRGTADDPYHSLQSKGDEGFWFGVDLHWVVGPGWTGELGVFTTDCDANGICVRFDPDGAAGPTNPILASPEGEIDIRQLEPGYLLVLHNLVFVQPHGGPIYRVQQVELRTG